MLYIAIIEDDPVHRDFLQKLVERCCLEADMRAEIGCFASSEAFLAATSEKDVHLALIDIVLTGEDGYKAASALRQRSLQTEIAFVTAHADKMPEAFGYRPIGFLEKPVGLQSVRRILDMFRFYHWHLDKFYTVNGKGGTTRVAHEDILFFESDNHVVRLVTANGDSLRFTGKLDDVERELAQYPYVRCHKSYLVRLDAIDYLDRTKKAFILNNGQVLPISKACYAEASRKFLKKSVFGGVRV